MRRGFDAADRLAFPGAESPTDHWQRIVLNETVNRYLVSLDPSTRTAAEIAATPTPDKPWKSYCTLDYPKFDLSSAPSRRPPLRRRDLRAGARARSRDPCTAARNLRELCVPGGHVIVSTPFLVKIHELPALALDDYWRFTPRGLRTLLEPRRSARRRGGDIGETVSACWGT